MNYTKEEWEKRLSERSDLSTSIVHLTRCGNDKTSIDNLIKILEDKKLIGSTTNSGFIVGSIPAVCFQDAPLYSISQNIWYEQKYKKENSGSKVRYIAAGIAFKKTYAYKKGARPVIYEQTSVAKTLLPPNEWWRIVNFDLSNDESIIDWTHEREWRCPNYFDFTLSEAVVLLPSKYFYKEFMKICVEKYLNILREINGIVVMSEILH